jgi:hypothetical protein
MLPMVVAPNADDELMLCTTGTAHTRAPPAMAPRRIRSRLDIPKLLVPSSGIDCPPILF